MYMYPIKCLQVLYETYDKSVVNFELFMYGTVTKPTWISMTPRNAELFLQFVQTQKH